LLLPLQLALALVLSSNSGDFGNYGSFPFDSRFTRVDLSALGGFAAKTAFAFANRKLLIANCFFCTTPGAVDASKVSAV